MTRIEKLQEKVSELYKAKHEGRAEWADYMYRSHVFIVSGYAHELSQRFGVQNDLPEAAAMLNDIADAVMSRFNVKFFPEIKEDLKEVYEERKQKFDI